MFEDADGFDLSAIAEAMMDYYGQSDSVVLSASDNLSGLKDLPDDGLACSAVINPLQAAPDELKPLKSIIKSQPLSIKKHVSISEDDKLISWEEDPSERSERVSYAFKHLKEHQRLWEWYSRLYEIIQDPEHPEYWQYKWQSAGIKEQLSIYQEYVCVDPDTTDWLDRMFYNACDLVEPFYYNISMREDVIEMANKALGTI